MNIPQILLESLLPSWIVVGTKLFLSAFADLTFSEQVPCECHNFKYSEPIFKHNPAGLRWEEAGTHREV